MSEEHVGLGAQGDDGIERLEHVEGHAFLRGHQQHPIAVLKNGVAVGRRLRRISTATTPPPPGRLSTTAF